MGFLQILFINLAFLVIIASKSSLSVVNPIAKPACNDSCGSVSIPYPFGTTKGCYHSSDFFVNCSQTSNSPKAFLQESSIEITDISLDGQFRVSNFVAHNCYDKKGRSFNSRDPWMYLGIFTLNNTVNKFTIVGCDTYGYISGFRLLGQKYATGCTAMCYRSSDLINGSCTGLGCCQIDIPTEVRNVSFELNRFDVTNTNEEKFGNCSYGFLVEESAFKFYPENLTNISTLEELPMVVDWAIGNGTCEEAKMNASSYACKSANSICVNKTNEGYGYRCFCLEGYQGNPYLSYGCQDVNECEDSKLNNCEKHCVNTERSFHCTCPKGYHGDGIKGGQGCTRGESHVFKLVAGIFLGIIVLLLIACWLNVELKRRRLIKMRRKFFRQNGGILLQEKITRGERSSDITTMFRISELQKATNNFHNNMIIGQGGFGTVYKGLLLDNKIVAIKKSKEIDPEQIEQFINEVIILSQINHRNVVKLLGCCLETQVPLLVYEFISNGTLFEHIHNKAKARFLSWGMRLKIATETANVLAYLHSTASTPIIHRDVKSANILLDHTLTAKVSDFGASRLVPLDQSQLSTMVHGTFGYLDPEYMQTNQLTEKSDVYSFGVVLVELLTGMKALSFDRPEEERGLANLFLSIMKRERLFEILEDNVVREGNHEQIIKVAMVAKCCLYVRGDDRPSMKEVAMELEGLRLKEKHPWAQTVHSGEGKESLLGEGFSGSVDIGEGNISSIGFDSVKDHIVLPVDGGR